MAVFYDVSQLTTGDLEYEIRQLTMALENRRELIAMGIIDDTVLGNRKYFMTDKIGELTRQRDNLLSACEELTRAMVDYQMLSEEVPPYKHHQMMQRARAAVAAATDGIVL